MSGVEGGGGVQGSVWGPPLTDRLTDSTGNITLPQIRWRALISNLQRNEVCTSTYNLRQPMMRTCTEAAMPSHHHRSSLGK